MRTAYSLLLGFPAVWLLSALLHSMESDVNGIKGLAEPTILLSVTINCGSISLFTCSDSADCAALTSHSRLLGWVSGCILRRWGCHSSSRFQCNKCAGMAGLVCRGDIGLYIGLFDSDGSKCSRAKALSFTPIGIVKIQLMHNSTTEFKWVR